jgi:carboxypeptidase PM20D1
MLTAVTAVSQRPAVMHEDPANAMLPEALSLLSNYLAIPSESGTELDAGSFLMDVCKDRGFHVVRFDSDTTGMNFVASLYPLGQGKPNIIFHNHIDVVHPGDEADWKHPPYSGTVSGQKVWGRGSIDNKGLAVIQVMAAASFISLAESEELPYNVSILSVSGEETGGQRGSSIVAEKYLDMLHPAVIIGEGSCGFKNMELLGIDGPVFGISIADKSMLWLEIRVRGEEFGHASTHAGSYPNKKLVEGLSRILDMPQKVRFNDASLLMFKHIGNIRGGFRGFAIRNLDHFPFRSVLKKYVKDEPRLEALACNTITLTHLHNPEGCVNQHSSEAHAYLDCRLLPGVRSEEMISDIRKVLDDDAFRIRVVTEGPPALITEPDGFYHVMAASINDVFPDAGVIPVLFPATTDNNYFREKGFPVYGINPFYMSMDQISSIHNTDEYMDIEDLRVGIEVFRVFIGKMMEEGLAY